MSVIKIGVTVSGIVAILFLGAQRHRRYWPGDLVDWGGTWTDC